MPICTFCKKHYELPRGLTIFTFDGKSLHFCSSKCKRNFDLKRDPRKTNWVIRERKGKEETEEQKKEKIKEQAQGSE